MVARKLLTAAEAAQAAGVSVSMIYRWTTEEKRLPQLQTRTEAVSC